MTMGIVGIKIVINVGDGFCDDLALLREHLLQFGNHMILITVRVTSQNDGGWEDRAGLVTAKMGGKKSSAIERCIHAGSSGDDNSRTAENQCAP